MSFEEALRQFLQEDQDLHRTRRIRIPEPGLARFCDNDYLGLASHPDLKKAALEALQEDSCLGAKASRLISGTSSLHTALEAALARFKKCEAALLFPQGYAAAIGTIPAVIGPGDTVILDKLAHACLIDGAKLSGAKLQVFGHNHSGHLEDILKESRKRGPGGKLLIVVESVYSMDGDLAPLKEIVELKERYGAWLMVDEAHATGIFGPEGRGLSQAPDLAGRVEIQMGTLSKAIGVSGGYISGSGDLIQLLTNRARSFLFTTAPPPVLSASALASLKIIQGEEGESLRKRLFGNMELFGQSMKTGLPPSPIVPVILGEESKTLEASRRLGESGFLVPAIRFPTVAKGQARLRVSLNSNHTPGQLTGLASLIRQLT